MIDPPDDVTCHTTYLLDLVALDDTEAAYALQPLIADDDTPAVGLTLPTAAYVALGRPGQVTVTPTPYEPPVVSEHHLVDPEAVQRVLAADATQRGDYGQAVRDTLRHLGLM